MAAVPWDIFRLIYCNAKIYEPRLITPQFIRQHSDLRNSARRAMQFLQALGDGYCKEFNELGLKTQPSRLNRYLSTNLHNPPCGDLEEVRGIAR
jgi:hypothetical protein